MTRTAPKAAILPAQRRVGASWLSPATAMVVALSAVPITLCAILIANVLLAAWPTQ